MKPLNSNTPNVLRSAVFLTLAALLVGGALAFLASCTDAPPPEEPTQRGMVEQEGQPRLLCADMESFALGCNAACPEGQKCVSFERQGFCACVPEGSEACHEEGGICVGACPGGLDCGRGKRGRCGCLL